VNIGKPQNLPIDQHLWIGSVKLFGKSPEGEKHLDNICERFRKGVVYSEDEIAELSRSLDGLFVTMFRLGKKNRELVALQEELISGYTRQNELLKLQIRVLNHAMEMRRLELRAKEVDRKFGEILEAFRQRFGLASHEDVIPYLTQMKRERLQRLGVAS
jgi:hypothetical protein